MSRNDGTKAQDTLYVAPSLQELLAGGRVLIDPNELSEDGTDSLSSYSVSDDGRYVVYGISVSGSDWNRFQLVDLATGDELGRISSAIFTMSARSSRVLAARRKASIMTVGATSHQALTATPCPES